MESYPFSSTYRVWDTSVVAFRGNQPAIHPETYDLLEKEVLGKTERESGSQLFAKVRNTQFPVISHEAAKDGTLNIPPELAQEAELPTLPHNRPVLLSGEQVWSQWDDPDELL